MLNERWKGCYLPVQKSVWTTQDCKLAIPCPHIALAARLKYSRIGYSGPLSLLRLPALHGGAGTRRLLRKGREKEVKYSQSKLILKKVGRSLPLTAAMCSVKVWMGEVEFRPHTNSLLSLPPDARSWLSGDHLRPQTSWRCPESFRCGTEGGARISLWRISRSRLPEASRSPFQARAPTRAVWPSSVYNRLLLATSHTWTVPRCVPTETRWPRSAHATDVTLSPSGARSHNRVTYNRRCIR